MRIAIGSGKGGTGKTTLSVNLALSLAGEGLRVHCLDCDVEEPNAHIFLGATDVQERPVTALVPEIDLSRCTYCGDCAKFCRFKALAVFPGTAMVFPEMCHNCGGCAIVCPEDAISEKERAIGVIRTSLTRGVKLTSGELNIGETRSPPLIREVKHMIDDGEVSIVDCPPGTACSFVEAVRGSNFCALVTEPTPFGLHDLKIAMDVVDILGIPYGVVINRCDIGDNRVEELCDQRNTPVLLKIPNDRRIAVAYSKGTPMIDAVPAIRQDLIELYRKIDERTGDNKR